MIAFGFRVLVIIKALPDFRPYHPAITSRFSQKRTGRAKTYYAREAILQHLDDLEDIYYAEKALAAIRSGRTKTIRKSDA